MPKLRPLLPVDQILSWADAHHRRSGRWPNLNNGPVLGAAGEEGEAAEGLKRPPPTAGRIAGAVSSSSRP